MQAGLPDARGVDLLERLDVLARIEKADHRKARGQRRIETDGEGIRVGANDRDLGDEVANLAQQRAAVWRRRGAGDARARNGYIDQLTSMTDAVENQHDRFVSFEAF